MDLNIPKIKTGWIKGRRLTELQLSEDAEILPTEVWGRYIWNLDQAITDRLMHEGINTFIIGKVSKSRDTYQVAFMIHLLADYATHDGRAEWNATFGSIFITVDQKRHAAFVRFEKNYSYLPLKHRGIERYAAGLRKLYSECFSKKDLAGVP